MSTPITRAPRATNSAAKSPTPHPRSRTVCPCGEGRASKTVGQSRQPNCCLYSLERLMSSSAGDKVDHVALDYPARFRARPTLAFTCGGPIFFKSLPEITSSPCSTLARPSQSAANTNLARRDDGERADQFRRAEPADLGDDLTLGRVRESGEA